MPTTLQFRRGTEAQNDAFIGAAGELSIDTTNDSIRVHDGSTSGGFQTIAREALYADLAERYHADAVYTGGTVVVFGGENEITESSTFADSKVAGVISTDPYIIMNSPHRQEELTDEYHPPLALAGRVPCRVEGVCYKGDLMVTGNQPGCAIAWNDPLRTPPAGSIIGKSIENKTEAGIGVIEVVVGVR